MFDSPYGVDMNTTLEKTLLGLAKRHLHELNDHVEAASGGDEPNQRDDILKAFLKIETLTELITIEDSGLSRNGLIEMVKIYNDGNDFLRRYTQINGDTK